MKPTSSRAAMPGWLIVVVAIGLMVGARYAIPAFLDNDPPPSAPDIPGDTRPASPYGAPNVVGKLQVPELTELSGLAASERNPGLLWAHNDSGDGPFVYCLETSGTGCGVWRVEGAQAVDWEDMAVAPDEQGVPSIHIADIGDNDRVRPAITVYRVEEPAVASEEASENGRSLRPDTFTLTYPDGPHDAESIVVNRATGDLYVITKDPGRSIVFVARAPLVDRAELVRVASMKITGLLADRTGASLSPSGNRVIFSTYVGGYELTLPSGRHFDAIWAQEAVPVDLGPHQQGEAVTYTLTGDTVISASEGARSAIYAVERRS